MSLECIRLFWVWQCDLCFYGVCVWFLGFLDGVVWGGVWYFCIPRGPEVWGVPVLCQYV